MICLLAFDSAMPSTRKIDNVESAIYLIRGQRVMLDADLAAIYRVTTKRLNEQLRRNPNRFPEDFAFQLTIEELTDLRSQFATSSLQINKARKSSPGRLEFIERAFQLRLQLLVELFLVAN
jgi:hypothetical protein